MPIALYPFHYLDKQFIRQSPGRGVENREILEGKTAVWPDKKTVWIRFQTGEEYHVSQQSTENYAAISRLAISFLP